MIVKIIEAGQAETGSQAGNWGKFLVGRMDEEWERAPAVPMGPEFEEELRRVPLLRHCGWSRNHLWVLDLQTGEGVCVMPGGHAPADLERHRVWVCPMFEPFLTWLYTQDLGDLAALPDYVALPEAAFAMSGYRRRGPS